MAMRPVIQENIYTVRDETERLNKAQKINAMRQSSVANESMNKNGLLMCTCI